MVEVSPCCNTPASTDLCLLNQVSLQLCDKGENMTCNITTENDCVRSNETSYCCQKLGIYSWRRLVIAPNFCDTDNTNYTALECDPLPEIDDGLFEMNSDEDSATLKCDPNYTMIGGFHSIGCKRDGCWETTEAVCAAECKDWVVGLDKVGEPCAVDVECETEHIVVKFQSTDYPLMNGTSEAYCNVMGTKVYFESNTTDNNTIWETMNIPLNQISKSVDVVGRQVYVIPCNIYYAGENFTFYKDRNFTAQCEYNFTDVISSMNVNLTITEEDNEIEDVESFYTTEPTAHLAVCDKDSADVNCTMSTDVTIGENVCLVLWSEQAIADLQIVEMSFSTSSGSDSIDLYENCERKQDLLIDSLFEPEPDFNATCNGPVVENCPKVRMQCFKVFAFKNENTLAISITLKRTDEQNKQDSCVPARRRRNTNEKKEEENIKMSVNLFIIGDKIMDLDEIIRAYQGDTESTMNQTHLIAIVAGSGLLIMIVALVIFVIKFKKVKMVTVDTRKMIS